MNPTKIRAFSGSPAAVKLFTRLRQILQSTSRTGTGAKGEVLGEFRATGFLPSYLNDLIVMGLVKPGEPYL